MHQSRWSIANYRPPPAPVDGRPPGLLLDRVRPHAPAPEVTRLRSQGRLDRRRRNAGAGRHDRGLPRCARRGPLGCRQGSGGLPHALGRGRLDARAGDPARAGPGRGHERVRRPQPLGVPCRLRPLGRGRTGHAPLSRAAGHRHRGTRAGLAREGLRSPPGRQPDPAPRSELARSQRTLPDPARRATAVLLLRGGRPGTDARQLPSQRGRFLCAGADADGSPRLGPGHVRARPRRQQERVGSRDAGVPRRRRAPDGGSAAAGVRGLARRAAGTRGGTHAGATGPPRPRRELPLQRRPVEDHLHQRAPASRGADDDHQPAQRLDRADVRAGPLRRGVRACQRPHDADRRNAPEPRDRAASARARDGPQAGAVARAREDPRALPRRTGSSPTRLCTTRSQGFPTAPLCWTGPNR